MQDELWHNLEGDECGRSVVDICKSLQSQVGARNEARWYAAWSRYEGKTISDVTCQGTWQQDCRYNVSRSAVDSAQAEIAARQRPKPMFLTSGADWQTKRRAKKLDRAVEAQFHQRQGARYADVWEMGEDCFRDATNDVGGVCKVVVDYAQERIRYERTPAYEVLVDPLEAAQGDPQNWFHVYQMDLSAAISMFVGSGDPSDPEKTARKLKDEELRAKLRNAAKNSIMGTTLRATKQVTIYEAWRLPFSADEPGKHVFACDDGVLLEEEWDWPSPPFAIIVWSREAYGIWGTGLVASGAGQHDKIQEIALHVDERFKHCAQRVIDYEAGSVDEKALESNDTVVYRLVRDLGKAPRVTDIPPITSAETEYLETEIGRFYEMQGVSQMSAQGRKEAGVDAAVAMQTLNDIKTVRFLPKARAYEAFFVRLGELTVRALRDLAIEKPNLMIKWPGRRYLEEIEWSKASLEENMYTTRVAPVSAMSRDPAQRLEIVEQLASLGFLPREKYFELLGMPDLDSLFDRETGESQWTERLIDRYLDAENDNDLDELGGFQEPDGYLLNATGAMTNVAQSYFDALVNDAPEFNADLLRRFMSSLRKIIEKSKAGAAAPPAMAGVPAVAPGMAAVPDMGAAMPVGPGQAPMPGMAA